ncbi:MAG: M20 family metallopeptidase [Candidatus Dormibacteraeota bacterium]|nr:M20 family metallopeptidase [Candidatus Dormibacteraeota bacterium]
MSAISAESRTRRLDELRARTDAMLASLEDLVVTESPSSDLEATGRCATSLAAVGSALLGVAPERLEIDGRTHLRWAFGPTRVAVIGHFDTVWPLGTVDRWPFMVSGGRATGPGTFDMKAGAVQALYGLSLLDSLEGVCVLMTSDEELGSPTSRDLVESAARGARAALVVEPAARDGSLKTGRKGVSMYTVRCHGVAAHASDPSRGANASLEMARALLEVERLTDLQRGTTVTPTLVQAGVTQNTIPDRAWFYTDCRVADIVEQERVEEAMRSLQAADPRVRLEVTGGPNRPPFPPSAGQDLFERATVMAGQMGLPAFAGVRVAGGSDGNFTAAMGVPTLDGLGAVGDLAHGEGEWVDVVAMPERAALLASLVEELQQDDVL